MNRAALKFCEISSSSFDAGNFVYKFYPDSGTAYVATEFCFEISSQQIRLRWRKNRLLNFYFDKTELLLR